MTETPTSEYMLLIRGTSWANGLSPEEIQRVTDKWYTWFDRLVQEGKITSGRPLGYEGKIVTGRKRRTVADGPFAESKEAVGGYIMLAVSDFNEAVQIAKACPGLDYEMTIEIRPLAQRCPPMQGAIEQVAQATA
jgi:hypothetical protein